MPKKFSRNNIVKLANNDLHITYKQVESALTDDMIAKASLLIEQKKYKQQLKQQEQSDKEFWETIRKMRERTKKLILLVVCQLLLCCFTFPNGYEHCTKTLKQVQETRRLHTLAENNESYRIYRDVYNDIHYRINNFAIDQECLDVILDIENKYWEDLRNNIKIDKQKHNILTLIADKQYIKPRNEQQQKQALAKCNMFLNATSGILNTIPNIKPTTYSHQKTTLTTHTKLSLSNNQKVLDNYGAPAYFIQHWKDPEQEEYGTMEGDMYICFFDAYNENTNTTQLVKVMYLAYEEKVHSLTHKKYKLGNGVVLYLTYQDDNDASLRNGKDFLVIGGTPFAEKLGNNWLNKWHKYLFGDYGVENIFYSPTMTNDNIIAMEKNNDILFNSLGQYE